jgi:putative ABC transport system ATP-binding protein
MSLLLETRQLACVADGQLLFSGLDLTLRAGERLAVTGPSGSGKSSLLALLSGLARPAEGEVLLDGEPVRTVATPAQGVAMILQGYGLVSLLTAVENVEVALIAAGWPQRQATAAADDALERLGLAAQGRQLAEELSGGQQQRVAVARALALAPRLLIADEPTAELDPASRVMVLSRLLEITDGGASLVLATHDPEVASSCDRVLDLRSRLSISG